MKCQTSIICFYLNSLSCSFIVYLFDILLLSPSQESMKFLENEKLAELTAELSDAVLGQSHRVLDGRIEAYTMKRAGNDKKFAHVLGQKYVADLEEQQQMLADQIDRTSKQQGRKRSNSATSAMEATTKKPRPDRMRSQSVDLTLTGGMTNKTTLGDFSELATRRLMTDLILTLNASFPDYDFSNTKPNQFEKLRIGVVRKRIYERLSELATFKSEKDWLAEMWMAVNDVIDLRECDIYSFEDEIDDENYLWSFHYFFVNKPLKRIVFFTCSEKIDEERQEVAEEKVLFYPADESQLIDEFDNYPNETLSGGMSVPIIHTAT